MLATQDVAIPGDWIKAYDMVQRLFDWTDSIVLGMILTGVFIFFSGALSGVTPTEAAIMVHITFV
jgi:hypothetical protein